MKFKIPITLLCFSFAVPNLTAQSQNLWHGEQRKIHYAPEGKSFVLKNGTRKFNRALYGSNTAFRVEAGDLPEFATYMPGMGGNLKLGIINGKNSKWLTESDKINTKYTPGIIEYQINDVLLSNATLTVQIVALNDSDGFILKVIGNNVPKNVSLVWAYGGASGKKFSRNGDIGGDPESVFYLHPEYCINNQYQINKNSFTLSYGSETNKKENKNTQLINAVFPDSKTQLSSANFLKTPLENYASKVDAAPMIIGQLNQFSKEGNYWLFENTSKIDNVSQKAVAEKFKKALAQSEQLANRIKVNTPDPYINTLGGALAMAADAIWENPAYLHGAVAWRMYLNAWRGAYAADPLGWHDRAKTHFESYGNSQVTAPETGPVVPDTTRNYARQLEKIGTSMFSSGYISRNPNRNDIAHHYDMNLVFIDQLVRHFKWTGDVDFLKKMWPVIKRHLAWEKRNYDVDGDGLYDAYAAIWASDGLGYSGGGVTYTSAYNYYANKMAAELAQIIGEDGTSYAKEAAKIHQAIQEKLWKNNKGTFAEYKDLLGNKLTHDTPGIWTIYHALDSEIANPFQAYQALKYIDNEIPHIPVTAEGLDRENLELISTTNWQPYTWSVNNVALAEVLHTALAYWQGGQSEKAYQLWESGLIESMYLGASPGAFEQLLFQDAIRGELYRDFADPVGMAGRSLVEGLFGIQPDALKNTLTIQPGLPKSWDHASLEVPDVAFAFERTKNTDVYQITPHFSTKMNLQLIVNATYENISKVTVNGKEVQWKMIDGTVGSPKISIESPYADSYQIDIVWSDAALEQIAGISSICEGEKINIKTTKASILEIKDTQNALKNTVINANEINAVANSTGKKSFFVKLKQKEMIWWQAIDINIKPNIIISTCSIDGNNAIVTFRNNTEKAVNGFLIPNQKNKKTAISFKANTENNVAIPLDQLVSGTNTIEITNENGINTKLSFTNWDITSNVKTKWETVKLDGIFNDKINNIFENKYLSPRAQSPSLQIPTQGIGNWCYPFIKPVIDDAGLRAKAGSNNQISSPQGVPFATPSNAEQKNIAFVSQWDNFPNSLSIPLSGKASQAYLMMAGTTNPMQSRFTNGEIIVNYTDGATEKLELKNPENWWPIEQDYYTDGYAFTTNAQKPPRVYLKTGTISRDFNDFKTIKGFSDFGVENGAATILDIPLNKNKTLKNLTVKAVANEVIIGIMSLTLNRE
ncbi:DUF4450 domain-containing protein [Flavobacterium seoulense]|uniref:Glycogen debranching enzyme n=1 Tax=Flavobacterium seoulense TaxID=1492738 RepID=A0A066WW49_9FLAO|nr:DUF4450 domain-containing protein [Flavobacterium seoulense]KDN54845.1 glycogen debranching enzyme [Flavobacterium seoulense]